MNQTMRSFFAAFGGTDARPKDAAPPVRKPPPKARAPKAPPPPPPSTYVRRSGGVAKVVEVRPGAPKVVATVGTDDVGRVVLPTIEIPAAPVKRRRVAPVTLDEAAKALAEARAAGKAPDEGMETSKLAKLVQAHEILTRLGGLVVERAELDRRLTVVATALETAERLRERGYPVLAERLVAEAPTLWRRHDAGHVIEVFLDSAAQDDAAARSAARYHAPGSVMRNMGSKGRGLDKNGLSMYGRVKDSAGGYAQRAMRAEGYAMRSNW